MKRFQKEWSLKKGGLSSGVALYYYYLAQTLQLCKNVDVQCLCLAPTYELAVQIGEVIEKMSKYMTGLRMRYATRGERGEIVQLNRESVGCYGSPFTEWPTKKVVIWDMQCFLWKMWCNVVQLHSLECKLLWIANHDKNALRAVKKFCLKKQSCLDVPVN